MKFQILSDLHLEFFDTLDDKINFLSSIKADIDYVLLAGDISAGKNLVQDYNLVSDILGEIIYIAGNHEYYHSSKHKVDELLACDVDGVFLNNQTIKIGDVTIIGGTGWNSSFNQRGADLMNDFKIIEELKNDNYKSLEWSKIAYDFFESSLQYNCNGKVICLTHNAPLMTHTPLKYAGSNLNPFFANDWSDLFKYEPDYWISGHLHESINVVYNKTRCIENSFGYVNNINEGRFFNKQLIIEV